MLAVVLGVVVLVALVDRKVCKLVWTKPTICVGLLIANVEVVPVPGFVAGVAEIRAMICPGVPEPPGAESSHWRERS